MKWFSLPERFKQSLRNLLIFQKNEKHDELLFFLIGIPLFVFVLSITLAIDFLIFLPVTTLMLIPIYFVFSKKHRVVFLILYTSFAAWLTIGYYVEVRENDKNIKIVKAAAEKYLAEKKKCPMEFSELVQGGFLLENAIPEPYHGYHPDPRSSWRIKPNEKEQKCDVYLSRGPL